jgi:hypothetical protein
MLNLLYFDDLFDNWILGKIKKKYEKFDVSLIQP